MMINFVLPQAGLVELKVFDVLDQPVQTLVVVFCFKANFALARAADVMYLDSS